MGKRGPTPVPTAILELRGSQLIGTRPNEPEAELGEPEVPECLTAEARIVWDQVVPQLTVMGVLAKTDGNALARYCLLWVRWQRAAQFIEKHGESYPLKSAEGEFRCFMPFPQAAVINKLSVLLLRLEQEFGLTPSARTRIQVAVKPKLDDPMSKLLDSIAKRRQRTSEN